jgi:hypothetical protein
MTPPLRLDEAHRQVVAHLTARLKGVTGEQAAQALERGKITARSCVALARHFQDHPDALTNPGPTPPQNLVRLAHALAAAGHGPVTLPTCAGCGKTSPQLTHRLPAGHCCSACARRVRPPKTCSGCDRQMKINARGPNGPLCGTCYGKHVATTCGQCGRVRRATYRMPDGSVRCQGATHALSTPASGAEFRPQSKRSRRTDRSAGAATDNLSAAAAAAEMYARSTGAVATAGPICAPAAITLRRSPAPPAAGSGPARAGWQASRIARAAVPAPRAHAHAVSTTVLSTPTGRWARSANTATRQCAHAPAPALSAKNDVHSSVPPKQRPPSADPAPESISPTRASAAARVTGSFASSCAPVAAPRNNWPKLSVEKTQRSPHSGRNYTRLSPPQDTPAEWRTG